MPTAYLDDIDTIERHLNKYSMEVLYHDGPYRHLRFTFTAPQPHNSRMFHLVTSPGWLFVHGSWSGMFTLAAEHTDTDMLADALERYPASPSRPDADAVGVLNIVDQMLRSGMSYNEVTCRSRASVRRVIEDRVAELTETYSLGKKDQDAITRRYVEVFESDPYSEAFEGAIKQLGCMEPYTLQEPDPDDDDDTAIDISIPWADELDLTEYSSITQEGYAIVRFAAQQWADYAANIAADNTPKGP